MAVHRLNPALRTPHRKSMKSMPIISNQTLRSIDAEQSGNHHTNQAYYGHRGRSRNDTNRRFFQREIVGFDAIRNE
jgi:hypothetical protein